jgi:hypothetical protein
MSNQLGRILVAGLGKMHFVAGPERAPLLAISGVGIIGRGNELSCWEHWLLPTLPSLLLCFKLLLPHGVEGANHRECFQPVRGTRSLEGIEEHLAIRSYLIGILCALLLLIWQAFLFGAASI